MMKTNQWNRISANQPNQHGSARIREVTMANGEINNNGFGGGFLADMLRDMKDLYGIEDNTKEKGKRNHKREALSEKNDKPATLPACSPVPQKKSQPVSPEVGFRPGDMILGTYRVESEPAMGGMGAVWRVHHTGWKVDLAMKRPRPEAFQTQAQKSNFIDECRHWINLGLHPNIVSCYYVRELEGIPTIFSEWMEKGSLESHIKDGTLYVGTEEEVQERLLDIAIQFARGLRFAHENNLIHQDVKPDNLLLSDGWIAKVSDFGLAKARTMLTLLDGTATELEIDPDATMLSPSGGRTPAYCSPEQAAAQLLTKRTDIYSWAVSVLEMYLGGKPWSHGRELTGPLVGTACRDYFEMCEEHPLPKALQDLLEKCLRKDPDERPHDFGETEDALLTIYRTRTGRDYPRRAPKSTSDTADSLNNRALSYADMGMPEEALKLWRQAAALDMEHIPARFNRALFQARSGYQYDYQVVEQLGSDKVTREAGLAQEMERAFRLAEPAFTPKGPQHECSFSGYNYYGENIWLRGDTLILVLMKKGRIYHACRLNLQTGSREEIDMNAVWREEFGELRGVDLHPDGEQLALLGTEGKLGIYHLGSGSFIKIQTVPELKDHVLSKEASRLACRYSKDGAILTVYELDRYSVPFFWTLLLDPDTLTTREAFPMALDSLPEKGGLLLHGRRKGSGHFLQRVEPDGSSCVVYRFPRGAKLSREVPDLRTGDMLLLYTLTDKSSFWLDASLQMLPMTAGERWIDRLSGQYVCADSGSMTLWYLVEPYSKGESKRMGVCDLESRKPLGTRSLPFRRTAGVLPDLAHGRLILWGYPRETVQEKTLGMSGIFQYQVCSLPQRPEQDGLTYRLSQITGLEQRLAEQDRIARMLDRFRAMEAAGRRTYALKCFREASDIPGFYGSAEAAEMEDALEHWAKRTALVSVRSLGIIPAVPDFSAFSQERVTVCEGGRLLAMSVEGNSYYENRVRVFTREGKAVHGLKPPSDRDCCFVRGDRVLALPSGFSFDLKGRTLRDADAEPWKPSHIFDVDPAGKKALFGRSDIGRTWSVWERNLETGESKTLTDWLVHAHPFYLADGSVLTEGWGKAERLVRLDAETGRILQNYELNHGWTLIRPSVEKIFLNQERRRFGVLIHNDISDEQYITMIFDMDKGLLCKWKGGETMAYIGDCFALRQMNHRNLEFWDLATGQPVHTDHSAHHITRFYTRPDGRELYVVRELLRGEETEAFRLEYDYDIT